MGIDADSAPRNNPLGPLPDRKPLLLTPNFGIKLNWGDASVVVAVSGEVDLYTAPWLAEELRRVERTARDVIVDLEQVEFIDCAGLRVLVKFARAAVLRGDRFSVTPGPPQVQKLFELSRSDQVVTVAARATRVSGPMAA